MRRVPPSLSVAASLWLTVACSNDPHAEPQDAAVDTNTTAEDAAQDARRPVSDAEPARDAGERNQSDAALPGADSGPLTQGDAQTAPDVQADASASDASASDASSGAGCTACLAHQLCEPSTQRCVDKYAPFALDCKNLPANAPCQGGPREVLLAASRYGRVLMLDPADGHFLGYFKNETLDLGSFSTYGYQVATQGPDQCVWTAFTSSGGVTPAQKQRAIERWNTDGSFRDHIVPRGKHFRDGDVDRVEDARTLAFSATHAYVSADARVTRYALDGSYVDEVLQFEPSALLVTRDGSLIANRGYSVVRVNGQSESSVISDVNTSQVAYASQGELLVAGGDGKSFRVNVETRVASEWQPDGEAVDGVALLGNGRYLFSNDDSFLGTLDPQAVPRGTFDGVLPAPLPELGRVNQLGRACLPEAFVQARAPKPPLSASECGPPAGAALFEEHFDEGDFVDGEYHGFRLRDVPEVEVSIVDGATPEARSLRIEGGDQHAIVVERAFDDVKPSYVGYRVKVAEPANWGAYLRLRDTADPQDFSDDQDVALVYAADGALNTGGSSATAPLARDTWAQVELRDFNWQERTLDLYVNCERVADDIAFRGAKIDQLVLYNFYAGAISQFDDLVIK